MRSPQRVGLMASLLLAIATVLAPKPENDAWRSTQGPDVTASPAVRFGDVPQLDQRDT